MSVSSQDSDSVNTAGELFSASFEGDYEDEQSWNAVGVLRRRNSDEVFHLAQAYCRLKFRSTAHEHWMFLAARGLPIRLCFPRWNCSPDRLREITNSGELVEIESRRDC